MVGVGTATWASAATRAGRAVGVLGLLVAGGRAGGRGPDDSEGPDPGSGGGGGGGSPRPRRPPPAGPVSWAEFERQFAAHVAARARMPRRTEAVGRGDGRPSTPA